MVSEMENDLTANLESYPLKRHLQGTSQTYSEHSQCSKMGTMTIPKRLFISRALRSFLMYTLTALDRSGIDLLRLGALLALLDATEGAEGGGSVTRLHCTPCRAQLVQGLSSSHCRMVS